MFTELISFEHIMGKEAYILRVVDLCKPLLIN